MDDKDQSLFADILKEVLNEVYNKKWDQVVTQEPILWTSFVVQPRLDEEKKMSLNEVYWEQTDLDKLKETCLDKLFTYNQINPSQRLDLVLFMNAIEHVLRIHRIINFPQGHGLLVGVGGSGRK